MGKEARIILLLELIQVAALVYLYVQYGDRVEALVTRAESVSGKLEQAGL